MKIQKYILILFIILSSLHLLSCGNNAKEEKDTNNPPEHSGLPDIPQEERYKTNYNDEEFTQKLNDWNTKRPENYSFEYHYVRIFDNPEFDVYAEVNVKGDTSEIVFFEEDEDLKTKQILRSYNIKYKIPSKGEDAYIESIDDFFSKIKALNTKYNESTEIEKAYHVVFNVAYNSEVSFPDDVSFILQYTKKDDVLDGGDSTDYKFIVTISNFKVLQ